MGFSTMLLRRWIGRSGAAGISRSSRSANSNHFICGLAAANRMISSSTSGSESAPWALMSSFMPVVGPDVMYHFYNLTKNEAYSFHSDDQYCAYYMYMYVGSSHGWLALYETKRNHRLLLLDPISNRFVELPPADSVVHSLVIGEEKGHLAFITLGDGDSSRLAFFSRRRRCYEWTPLLNPKKTTKERVYDSIAYSSRLGRLFCLTEEKEEDNLELECWDLSDEFGSPSVETMELHLDFPLERDSAERKLKYIVCAEEEVYVVVRHVVMSKEFVYNWKYKFRCDTVGMDVFRIEKESGRGKAVRMEDSLEGLAMFVGNNHAVAIRATEHANVKPNCIYFISDSRVKKPEDMLGDWFEGGIFDYEKKVLLPLYTLRLVASNCRLPIWYTPPLDSVYGRESAANRVMSGVSSGESPSVMPPPVFKGDDLVRNLAVDRVFNVNKAIFGEMPEDDAEVVGISHGWVALLNRRNNDLFLSDPLSQRHIKLPPLDALPDPYFNLDLDGRGSVSKLILSSSPDDEDCRAMMSFGPAKRLAFCLPGRSSEWTPIGDLYLENYQCSGNVVECAWVHEDLVYRSRRKLFTSMGPCTIDFSSFLLEDNRDDVTMRKLARYNSESWDWDIQDPASAKLVRTAKLGCWMEGRSGIIKFGPGVGRGRTLDWLEENKELLEKQCLHIPHLVYAEESDQLFMVMRFVMLMNPYGSGLPLGYIPRCEVKGLSEVFPCKTFGFVVMRIDDNDVIVKHEECNICTIVEDLNGMSMVVGIDGSVAISSTQLKPNCIYFSDAKRMRMVCGVNDSGIFDYESKIISPYDSPTSTPYTASLLHSNSKSN